jgi:hypothetical protein
MLCLTKDNSTNYIWERNKDLRMSIKSLENTYCSLLYVGHFVILHITIMYLSLIIVEINMNLSPNLSDFLGHNAKKKKKKNSLDICFMLQCLCYCQKCIDNFLIKTTHSKFQILKKEFTKFLSWYKWLTKGRCN